MIPLIGLPVKNREEEAIFFGHHHPVHYFKNEKTLFLNPGSLGCNDEPAARYAIVNANSIGIHILLKKASYNNIPFLLSFEKLQVPDRDFILKVFHGNQLQNFGGNYYDKNNPFN